LNRSRRLLDDVRGWAARDGAREAIVDGSTRLTYADLAAMSEQVAEDLQRAGLTPGARVAFLGTPGASFLVSQLATHAVGGVWLGLNPKYTAHEFAHVLADACPSLLVVDVGQDDRAVVQALEGLDRPPAVQRLRGSPISPTSPGRSQRRRPTCRLTSRCSSTPPGPPARPRAPC
jgi:acyl-CoA synthetase (AMP-forming)/AMP-acid ligase II